MKEILFDIGFSWRYGFKTWRLIGCALFLFSLPSVGVGGGALDQIALPENATEIPIDLSKHPPTYLQRMYTKFVGYPDDSAFDWHAENLPLGVWTECKGPFDDWERILNSSHKERGVLEIFRTARFWHSSNDISKIFWVLLTYTGTEEAVASARGEPDSELQTVSTFLVESSIEDFPFDLECLG